MKAHKMLSIACALAACATIGCSSDSSVPTDPTAAAMERRPPAPGSGMGITPKPDTPPEGSQPQPGMRTIGEFLARQGTYCVDDGMGGCMQYAPPVANYMAWYDRSQDRSIVVDYAGLANTWLEAASGFKRSLGTQVTGTINENPMEDGRALVTVDLHTTNAMSFMVQGPQLANAPIFGSTPQQLLDESHRATVGDAHIHLVFVNNAVGAPLPDLVQLVMAPQPGQQLVDMRIHYDGNGQVFAPDGPMGHVSVGPDGPFMQAFPGSGFAPMGVARIESSM